MLVKTFEFTNYNDELTKETYCFHLSKAELIELEIGAHKAGFQAMMKQIIETEDRPQILANFKRIVLLSVGQRSADGNRFIKTQEIRDAFEQSPAYDELLVSFFSEPNAASAFIEGIMPKNLEGTQDKPILPPPSPTN